MEVWDSSNRVLMIDVCNWDENTRCSLSPLVCLWQKYTGLKVPCFPVASAEEVAGAPRSASLCFTLKASKEINDEGILSVQPPARWADFWPYWSGSFRLKCLQPGVDLLGFLCEPGHHGTESGGISGCRGCSSVYLPVTHTIFFTLYHNLLIILLRKKMEIWEGSFDVAKL